MTITILCIELVYILGTLKLGGDFSVIFVFMGIVIWISSISLANYFLTSIIVITIDKNDVIVESLGKRKNYFKVNEVVCIQRRTNSYRILLSNGKVFHSYDQVSKIEVNVDDKKHQGILGWEFPYATYLDKSLF